MARSTWTAVVLAAVTAVVGSPLFATGCKVTGVGDPCIPEQEYDPTFNGFDEQEVNVESKSFQCQTRVCLVNHFRGRVSCPYGQDKDGKPPSTPNGKDVSSPAHDVGPCTVPNDTTKPVTGDPNPNNTDKALVKSQCFDRTTDKAVYCSCRCADIDGNTTNGNFCTCPDGYTCTQLVSTIGQGNEGLTGAYCIKNGTGYTRGKSCTGPFCDPTIKGQNCP